MSPIETIATVYPWRGSGMQLVTRGGYVYLSWRWPFVTVCGYATLKAD